MNTIDELRASLASHADDLSDPGLGMRADAVHARVRRVRRTRRAALAGGLAAAVVAAGVGATLAPLHEHRSLEQTTPLAGHAIARDVDIAGFTYQLGATAQSRPGDPTLTMALPATRRDRVISLVASGLGAGRATLFLGNGRPDYPAVGGQPAGYDADHLLDRVVTDSAADPPVELPVGATRLTVRLQNAPAGAVVGLAVYDQSTAPPAGVRADGMAFPAHVGEKRLVTAVIGRQGEDAVSLRFEGPLRHPDLESLCATSEKRIWGHVTDSATKGWSGRECQPLDPTNDLNLGVGHDAGVPSAGYGPGMHTLTLKAFRDRPAHAGTPVHPTDLRLALGLYADPSPRQRVDGSDWDTRMLSGGRMWQLDRVVPYVEGRTTVAATSAPAMLAMEYAGRARTCVQALASDGATVHFDCTENRTGGSSGSWGYVLMPGATYTISTQDPNDERKPGVGLSHILIYRPAP